MKQAEMKAGDIYTNFGCIWIVDRVYDTPREQLAGPNNPYGLIHKKRITAHVIAAPPNYQGVREMDSAIYES